MHHPMRKTNLRNFASRTGFTLIELLIVIGIGVALTALSLAAIIHAKKKGFEIRVQSDLGLIGMALEAYKADFGDYPRFDDATGTETASTNTALYSADSLNTMQDRGARLLCRALLSPGPALLNTTAGQTLIGFDASKTSEGAPDGADGPGFRLRSNQGKIHPAYLDSTKFKVGNPAAPLSTTTGNPAWDSLYYKDATLLDTNGNSILYFPAYTSAVITGTPGSAAFVTAFPPPGNGVTLQAGVVARPYYNAFDNNHYGPNTNSGKYILYYKQLQYIMGDRNEDGVITAPESAATNIPYLLWTAGTDGVFGFPGVDSSGVPIDPKTAGSPLKTDDITNFDIAADLRK